MDAKILALAALNKRGGDSTQEESGGSVTNYNTINQHFYNSGVTGKYDLKDGYGYTADMYIAADGTETTRTGLKFSVTDYIPVEASVPYTTFGIGYALYSEDKTFISAVVNIANIEVREFVPTENGFVRISYRNEGRWNYCRLCKSEDKTKTPLDYLPKVSPFSDPTIPCEIDLFGDSNSYGYGLSDTANSWANRLGSLITNMPTSIRNNAGVMSVFSVSYDEYPKLGTTGVLYFSAYTDSFIIHGQYITAVDVYIDGVAQTQMTTSPAEYAVGWGYHTIELRGVTGNNVIYGIVTNKKRSFTNNAVTGKNSDWLTNSSRPALAGNIAMVMLGTNDRTLTYGESAEHFVKFIRECYASGIEVYLFSPIPTKAGGENHTTYIKSINEVINEIPNVNYIDVYKDMQLFSLLSTETLYNDALHLNEYGHKVLYCIAASGLKLAALNSIFDQ